MRKNEKGKKKRGGERELNCEIKFVVICCQIREEDGPKSCR
jgi:hypothetical protein